MDICNYCGKNANTLCFPRRIGFQKMISESHMGNITYMALNGYGIKYKLNHRRCQRHNPNLKDFVAKLLTCSPTEKDIANIYKSHFRRMRTKAREIVNAVRKNKYENGELSQGSLMKMFGEVISIGFSEINKCILTKFTKLIITRSLYECIYEDDLVRDFDIESIKWLPLEIQGDNASVIRQMLLKTGIKLLIFDIILPMFNALFVTIHGHANELIFILRHTWNRAVNKYVALLQKEDYIESVAGDYVKTKPAAPFMLKPKVHNLQELDINSFRVIARFSKRLDKNNGKIVAINEQVKNLAKKITFVETKDFYSKFQKYTSHYKGHKLFVVKLDLSDCYGNIAIPVLKNSVLSSWLTQADKEVLIHAMHNQYIMFGKTGKRSHKIWKWKHGLLQGMRFSGVLCELYLANREATCFGSFNKENCFVYRHVDDYFFASTKRSDVISFVEIARKVFIINESKTQSNVLGNRSHLLEFLAMEINVHKLGIKCAFNLRDELHKQFRFWNIKHRITRQGIFDRATYYKWNQFYFQKAFMDVNFNGVQLVLENFFESMVFMALKLDAAIMSATCRKVKPCHYAMIHDTVQGIIKCYAIRVVCVWNKSCKGRFILHRKLLILAQQAFKLVFLKRKNEAYNKFTRNIQAYFDDISSNFINQTHNKDVNGNEAKLKVESFLQNYNKIPKRLQCIRMQRKFQHFGTKYTSVSG